MAGIAWTAAEGGGIAFGGAGGVVRGGGAVGVVAFCGGSGGEEG